MKIIYMYEKRIPIDIDINWSEAYIYRKQNMSIYKIINLDTNWKNPMIPIKNNNVNQVYNS